MSVGVCKTGKGGERVGSMKREDFYAFNISETKLLNCKLSP